MISSRLMAWAMAQRTRRHRAAAVGCSLREWSHPRSFLENLEPWIVFELLQSLQSTDARKHVDVPCHHRCHLGICVSDELERDFAQLDVTRASILRIPFENHRVTLRPFHELERPRSHGMGRIRLCGFRCDDNGRAFSQIEQQEWVGFLQANDESLRVESIQALHIFEPTLALVRALLRRIALERELDVSGIESTAVRKSDALPQLEREGLQIIRNGPVASPARVRPRHARRYASVPQRCCRALSG